MSVNFFDLTKQSQALKAEIDEDIARVIKSGKYVLGENVAAAENEIARYCGAGYGVGVASGTDALHLSLRAVGIKPGDEVITTPFTFVATAEAISYCGATPVFVDIEPKTLNIAVSKIKQKITNETRAILPVHLYGQPCEVDAIIAIAREHRLYVVEDCAQAIGAEYRGQKVGAFGDIGCFSFFPTKNLGCYGDGGMIVTNNEKFAEEIKVLRDHGSRQTYHYDMIGYNSRLDEIQAALLRVKLPHLDSFIAARIRNAQLYRARLAGIEEILMPEEIAGAKHSYNQFTIRVKNRAALQQHLKRKGIGSMIYYPLSLHLQKAYSQLGYRAGDFPVSETIQAEVLSLPIYPELSPAEIDEVCSAILEFFAR